MKKVVFVFPGQGSQHVGMGKSSLHNQDFARYLMRADEVLGFEISKIMLEGPEDELNLTQNTQPIIFTMSYALFQLVLKAFGGFGDHDVVLCGHSLGEYTAVACGGALSFEDGVRLVRMRGKFMQEAVPEGQGAMLAIMLGREAVERELEGFSNIWIANINSQDQIVVSGKKGAIEDFLRHLRGKNVRAVPLKVSAPFHCPLMEPAKRNLERFFEKLDVGNLRFKVLSAHTLSYYTDDGIKQGLINGVTMRVDFYGLVLKLYDEGYRTFVEVGPGRVLSSLIRRILKDRSDISVFGVSEVEHILHLGL